MTILFSRYPRGGEAPTPRYLLIQGCNPATQSAYKGLAYGRIEARVVRGETLSEVTQGRAPGYRWADWSSAKPTAKFVNDLVFAADVHPRGPSFVLQQFRFYFDLRAGEMTYHESTLVHATLKWLQTQHDTLERYGGHVEFQIYLRTMAKRLGFDDLLVYQNDEARGDLDAGNFDIVKNFKDGMGKIDAIARKIAGDNPN